MLFRKIFAAASAVFAATALFAADTTPLVIFQVKNTMNFMQQAQKYAMAINPNIGSMIPMYGTALLMNPQVQGIDFNKPVTVMGFEQSKTPVIVAYGTGVQPQNIMLPNSAVPLVPKKSGNNIIYAADNAMYSAGAASAGLTSSVPGNGIVMFFPNCGKIAEHMLADAQKKATPGNAQQAQAVEGLKLFKEYMANFSNFGIGLSFAGDKDLVLTFGATALPGTDVSKYFHASIPVPSSPLPVLDNSIFYMGITSPNTPELYKYSRKASQLNTPENAWMDELYKQENFTGIVAGSGIMNDKTGEFVMLFSAEMNQSAIDSTRKLLEDHLTKLPQGLYRMPLPQNGGDMEHLNFFVQIKEKCLLYIFTSTDELEVENELKNLKTYTISNSAGEYASIFAKVAGTGMTKVGSVSVKGDAMKLDIHFTTEVMKKVFENIPAPGQTAVPQQNSIQMDEEFVPEDFN